MGVLGRSRGGNNSYGKQMRKSLDDAAEGKKGKKKVFSFAGDPTEVAEVVEGTGDGGLKSFFPTALKCLDALPSLQLKSAPNYQEILKMGKESITVAQNVTTELQRMQSDAPSSIHTLGFLGGFALCGASAYNFIGHVFTISPLHMFFSVMMVVYGVAMLVLEQQRAIFPSWMRTQLEHYFLFLTLVIGRGLFYIYVGSVQAAVNWGLNVYAMGIGVYVAVVGFMYVITGYSVQSKLGQLQHSLHSPEVIERAFRKADADKSGELDVKELKTLMANLGSTLTEKEADITLTMLDKNGNGTVSLDEFLKFMERKGDDRFF